MAKASVTVKIEGIQNLLADMQRVEDLAPLRPLLMDAASIAKNTAQNNAPSFSGKLRGSFTVDIDTFEARVHTPLDYARVMEFGRKPSAVSALRFSLGLQNAPKLPPPAALRQWATAHGFASTYVLARAIARRGQKGRFFRRKARRAVREALPGLVNRMSRQLEAGWG